MFSNITTRTAGIIARIHSGIKHKPWITMLDSVGTKYLNGNAILNNPFALYSLEKATKTNETKGDIIKSSIITGIISILTNALSKIAAIK